MTKQTKKLIAIFVIMAISMFAIIKAFGVDCTYKNRTTEDNDQTITINPKVDLKREMERAKVALEGHNEGIKYYEELKQYNKDYYKWQEECRKLNLKYNKDMKKYSKDYIKLIELVEDYKNGETEEIRNAAKEKMVKIVKSMKVPEVNYPKEPVKPEFRF